MSDSKDEKNQQKQSAMKKVFDDEAHRRAKELLEEQLQRRIKNAQKIRNDKEQKQITNAEQKRQRSLAKIEDRIARDHVTNLHISSLQSMLMEMEPAMKDLIYLLVYSAIIQSKKLSVPLRNQFTSGSWPWLKGRIGALIFSPDPVAIPELQFAAETDEHGRISLHWARDSFGELFTVANNASPEVRQKVEEAFSKVEQLLEESLFAWIETLDGLGPEGLGYFLAPSGDAKNRQYLVYPKSVGKLVDDKWVLDEDKVKDSYAEDNCELINGVLTPKLGVSPKDGKSALHVDPNVFKKLMFNDSERSFSTYFNNKYQDIKARLVDDNNVTYTFGR